MTREQAIAIIRKEYLCVDRDCDIEKNCGKCDLVMPSKEPILEAYKIAIKALEQEPCREADDYENEISDLYNRLDIVEYDKERLREEVTTLEEKLKGLSAELCDAISRQAAIDAMCALCNTGETLKENPWRDNPHIDAIIDALDNLPSVTPQPKTGRWIVKTYSTKMNDTYYGYECDQCHKEYNLRTNYCPNCGAKMQEVKEWT